MDLEEELGKKLFERTNKNIRLTEDGVLFKQTAIDILALYQKAKMTNPFAIEGDLYLGAAETNSFLIVAKAIKSFHDKHPKARFHVIAGTSEEINDHIEKGTVDLGFIISSISTLKLQTLDLGVQERWGVILPVDHPFAGKEAIGLEDLQGQALILPENSHFQNMLKEWHVDLSHVVATYTMVTNGMLMTLARTGIAICLETKALTLPGLHFVPFSPKRTADMLLVWKEKPAYTALFQAFLNEFAMQNANDK